MYMSHVLVYPVYLLASSPKNALAAKAGGVWKALIS